MAGMAEVAGVATVAESGTASSAGKRRQTHAAVLEQGNRRVWGLQNQFWP